MFDIHHKFPINSPIERVFEAISKPEYIDKWWSRNSEGTPELNSLYKLEFGPGYQWKASVISFNPPGEFALQLLKSDDDWLNTIVYFKLSPMGTNKTDVEFSQKGWPEKNEHFRISNYCWAMYLRLMKRYLEFGEEVPYEKRLDV